MLIKKVYKTGQILIPKQIQKQFRFFEGDTLNVYHENNLIIVEKSSGTNQLNECILSGGRISIPIELRRILNIKLGDPLLMETINYEKKIILRKSYSHIHSKEA